MNGRMRLMAESRAETSWCAARVGLLIEHYRAGLSAVESAALIGGVSKNAVVSKRRRLGLFAIAGRPGFWADDFAGVRPRRERTRPVRAMRGPPPLPVEPLPKMDCPPPLDADPRTLAARGFGQCAWPLGAAEEPGDYRTLFCGAPVSARLPYCRAHAARAYRRRA